MRTWWCVPALLLALAAAVTAQTEIATDATGDLQATTPAGTQPFATQHYQQLDLAGFSITETETTLQMVLALAATPDTAVYIHEDGVYYIDFRHNDQVYRIQLNMAFAEQVYTWGILQKYSAESEGFTFTRFFPVTRDVGAGTLSWEVLREDLTDTNGAAPYPGRTLEDFHIRSHLRQSQGGFGINDLRPMTTADIHDAMPDDGPSTTVFEFQLGLQQSGTASLWSDAPMRASNGEASTFVFTLRAQNMGTEQDTYRFETMGEPQPWDVTIPNALVVIQPGEVVEIPIVVSTPFAHQHGAVETMHVHMISQSDPNSIGRAEIGIRYHAVPQPAGHHDQFFFHSTRFGEDNPFFIVTDNLFAGNSGFPSFNTLENDPNDQDVPIRGNYNGYNTNYATGGAPAGTQWSWFVWLSPDLEMGLDFDMTRNGSLTFPLSADIGAVQGEVSAQLWHFAFDESRNDWNITVAADMGTQGPIDLTPGQSTLLTFDIQATPEADLLPFSKRAALAFVITFETPRPGLFDGTEAPMLMPGGFGTLPLLEYRDPVQDQFKADGPLHIQVPAAHPLNPGATRVWNAELHNMGDAPVSYELLLDGVHAEWAELLTPATGRIGPQGTVALTLVIEAPADAVDGDAADLVLTARDLDNPTVQAIGRFLVEIDEDGSHPDDAELAEELRGQGTQDTPPLPLALLVLALVATARRRR